MMSHTPADQSNDHHSQQEVEQPTPVESTPIPDPLMDAETQAAYRREYQRQLRQRSCPGCGEGDEVF